MQSNKLIPRLDTMAVMVFSVSLFFTSCKKDKLTDLSQDAIEQTTGSDHLALEKAILEFNFQVPTEGLSDEQILQQYNQYMSFLEEADRTQVLEIFQNAMAREYDFVAGNMVSSRSTESMVASGVVADRFGGDVITMGNKVYVGAPNGQKVYEYTKTGGDYVLTATIAPTGATGNFGASIGVSGAWMAIGASSTAGGGKVFMYKKQGNHWVQQTILSAPAGQTSFGGLQLQGNTLAVHSTAPGFPYKSSISIFNLSGNNWVLSQTLAQSSGSNNYWYLNMDMSEDGTRIAAATALNNNLAIPRAHIFVREGSTWVFEQEVALTTQGVNLCFEVAIEGGTLAIPCMFPGNRHFVATHNGSSWEVSQEINTPPGAPFSPRYTDIQDLRVVLGAASNNNTFPDEVHIFDNFGGYWDLTETLSTSDLGVGVSIGSVAIGGNTIVAGCPNAFPNTTSGKAYIWD